MGVCEREGEHYATHNREEVSPLNVRNEHWFCVFVPRTYMIWKRNMISVFEFAVLSRVATVTLMIAFDLTIDNYDTSSTLTPYGSRYGSSEVANCRRPDGTYDPDTLECTVCRHVEGLVTWDSVYFVQIALEGYEYEQSRAFFPALPAAMRWLARLFGGPELTRCGVTLAGLVITNVAFIASAVLLEELGAAVLGGPRQGGFYTRQDDAALAKAAALLYTFNPASTFHSAIYTEPLFALLSFAGCLALVWGRRNVAACLFACTCWVRSNGILHLIHLGKAGERGGGLYYS